ncbi:MAG: ABC transporter permease, partial [Anaerolineae bacterium]
MTATTTAKERRGLLDTIRRRPSLQVLVLIFPSLFWLIVFFTLPLVIVFVYSFLKRGPYGQIVWEFNIGNYGRFFDPLYLKIFVRSFRIAGITTLLCFLLGYPMAYWIATRPPRWRNTLLLLLMIPFWTNFLVRTYAWILILRDTGLINNLLLSAGLISEPLPLFGNDFAIILGLVYGWFPDMVLPCYAAIERL